MSRATLFGDKPAPRRAVQHACVICGRSAGLGFAAPGEFMPAEQATEWACREHVREVAARWASRYSLRR